MRRGRGSRAGTDLRCARAQLRIEHPALRTGLGVEREHALERRAVVQRWPDHERVDLECSRRVVFRAGVEVAAAVLPDELQTLDVARIDLGQRRVAQAARIAAEHRPVGGRTGAIDLGRSPAGEDRAGEQRGVQESRQADLPGRNGAQL